MWACTRMLQVHEKIWNTSHTVYVRNTCALSFLSAYMEIRVLVYIRWARNVNNIYTCTKKIATHTNSIHTLQSTNLQIYKSTNLQIYKHLYKQLFIIFREQADSQAISASFECLFEVGEAHSPYYCYILLYIRPHAACLNSARFIPILMTSQLPQQQKQ